MEQDLNQPLDIDLQPVRDATLSQAAEGARVRVEAHEALWLEVATPSQTLAIYATNKTDMFLLLNTIGRTCLDAAQEMHVDMHGGAHD